MNNGDSGVIANVHSYLSARPEPLYGVVDTARTPRLLWQVTGQGARYESLFAPSAGALTAVAPYLVRLPPESQTLKSLIYTGWGDSCGVYLTTGASIEALWQHLHQFLMVRAEDGQSYYFRYYDPRVLRKFLPTCSDEQAAVFFGPVTHFFLEGDNPAQLVEFARHIPPGTAPPFVLRMDQIGALERIAAYEVLERLEATLREDWPDECKRMGPEALRQRVKNDMLKARRYGIELEDDILKYLNLTMLWSETFDKSPQTPWAWQILNRSDLTGTEKVHLLQYCSAQAVDAEPGEA